MRTWRAGTVRFHNTYPMMRGVALASERNVQDLHPFVGNGRNAMSGLHRSQALCGTFLHVLQETSGLPAEPMQALQRCAPLSEAPMHAVQGFPSLLVEPLHGLQGISGKRLGGR